MHSRTSVKRQPSLAAQRVPAPSLKQDSFWDQDASKSQVQRKCSLLVYRAAVAEPIRVRAA